MIWSCSICIGRLEGNKDGSCTACGHVFHSECLARWLASKNSCPVCRLRVYNTIKLYPSLSVDDESLAAEDEMEKKVIEINKLKAQIDVLNKNAENTDYELKNVYSQNMVAERKLREAYCKTESVLMELESANCEKWKALREQQLTNFEKLEALNKLHVADLKLRKMSDLEQQVQNLKVSLVRSTEELSFLNNVRTVVDGQLQDVEQILIDAQANFSAGNIGITECVKRLATFCAILKHDLISTNAAKNHFKDAFELFKTEFMVTRRNIL